MSDVSNAGISPDSIPEDLDDFIDRADKFTEVRSENIEIDYTSEQDISVKTVQYIDRYVLLNTGEKYYIDIGVEEEPFYSSMNYDYFSKKYKEKYFDEPHTTESGVIKNYTVIGFDEENKEEDTSLLDNAEVGNVGELIAKKASDSSASLLSENILPGQASSLLQGTDSLINKLGSNSTLKSLSSLLKKTSSGGNKLNTLAEKAENGTALAEIGSFNLGEFFNRTSNGFMASLNKGIGLLKNAYDGITSKIDQYKGFIDGLPGLAEEFQKKYNLSTLFNKLGFGDNELLKALSSTLGLDSGLFDSWATDLLNTGLSYYKTLESDILNSALGGISYVLQKASVQDIAILGLIAPIRTTLRANLNINGQFQRLCLEYDLLNCLKYLDDFNNSKYDFNNNYININRAYVCANYGGILIPKYICSEIYKIYKDNTTGTNQDDENLAYRARQEITRIFKYVIVHSYSLTPQDISSFTKEFPFLSDFSVFGKTDKTFNNFFNITLSDINIMAPIVEIDTLGNDDSPLLKAFDKNNYSSSWFSNGSLSHKKTYIEPRNPFIKSIYVALTSGSNKMVNQNLYERLKYPTLDVIAKSTKESMNSIKSSDSFKDLRYLTSTGDRSLLQTLNYIRSCGALRPLNATKKLNPLGEAVSASIGEFEDYVPEVIISPKDDITDSVSKIKNAIKGVFSPSEFGDTSLSYDDFELLDISTLSNSDIQVLISNILKKSHTFSQVYQINLNRFSDTLNSYSNTRTFILFCNDKAKFNSLSSDSKLNIFYSVLVYNMIIKYVYDYDLDYLKTWYGETIGDENIPNEDISKILEYYRSSTSNLLLEKKTDSASKKFKIEFDAQNFGSKPENIYDIEPFSNLSSYKVDDLYDTNNKLIFLGWTKDLRSNILFDWNHAYITDDIYLYAVWKESERHIDKVILKKSNNSTLSEDVYGFIDESTKTVVFALKTSEIIGGPNYIYDITLPEGCKDITETSKILSLNTDANPSSKITIKDYFGNITEYKTRYFQITDNLTRMYYITYGAQVSDIDDSKLFFNRGDGITFPSEVNKENFSFNGWSPIEGSNQAFATGISGDSDNPSSSYKIVYASLTRASYNIIYSSYENNKVKSFTGIHESSYPIKGVFDKATVLDVPTKKGYVFLGYYSDYTDDKPIKVIPAYTVNSNRKNLYAKWISKVQYDALNTKINVNGYDVLIANLIFYTTMVKKNGSYWNVSHTGLNSYTSTNHKIENMNYKIGGKIYIPLGVTYVKDANAFFCLSKYKGTEKMYMFYSVDDGITWVSIGDVTNINTFNIFDGIGYEDVSSFKYFIKILFKGMIYQSYSTYIYDNINRRRVADSNICGSSWPENRSILGFCITVDGYMFILFENWGVLKVENWLNGEDVRCVKVSEWDDNLAYIIDRSNLGSPFNIGSSSFNPNDDFDIDDEGARSNLLSFFSEKEKTIYTYRNAEKMTITYKNFTKTISILDDEHDSYEWVLGKVNDDPNDTNYNMFLNNYYPNERYIPDVAFRPKEDVTLTKVPTSIAYKPNDAPDPYSIQVIPEIDSVNCYKYIGYHRCINEEAGVYKKITEDYLVECGILKRDIDNGGQIVVITQEMVNDASNPSSANYVYSKRIIERFYGKDTEWKVLILKSLVNKNGEYIPSDRSPGDDFVNECIYKYTLTENITEDEELELKQLSNQYNAQTVKAIRDKYCLDENDQIPQYIANKNPFLVYLLNNGDGEN